MAHEPKSNRRLSRRQILRSGARVLTSPGLDLKIVEFCSEDFSRAGVTPQFSPMSLDGQVSRVA